MPLNDRQIPNFRAVRVCTGYNPGEGKRRAWRNGRVSSSPTPTPTCPHTAHLTGVQAVVANVSLVSPSRERLGCSAHRRQLEVEGRPVFRVDDLQHVKRNGIEVVLHVAALLRRPPHRTHSSAWVGSCVRPHSERSALRQDHTRSVLVAVGEGGVRTGCICTSSSIMRRGVSSCTHHRTHASVSHLHQCSPAGSVPLPLCRDAPASRLRPADPVIPTLFLPPKAFARQWRLHHAGKPG
jgi:hypothetical protein